MIKINQHTLWKEIKHPQIKPGYYINEIGEVYHENSPDVITKADYHATNEYDFILLCDNTSLEQPRLFPIDDLMAMTFIPIPDELKDKRVKVSHINGDTRDNLLDNLQWVEDIEEWRVCTYPGVKPDTYEVSSWGRIRNKITGNMLSGWKDRKGYIRVELTTNHTNKVVGLHRLISYSFCVISTDYFDKYESNHIDGIKGNNHFKNLEMVSGYENLTHAYLVGLNKDKLENHTNAILTNNDVEKISQMIVEHKGNLDDVLNDALNHGISVKKYMIKGIKYKNNWKPISDKYFKLGEFNYRNKFNENDVTRICEALIKFNGNIGKTLDYLKRDFENITRSDIKGIKSKRNYSNISDRYFKCSGKFFEPFDK